MSNDGLGAELAFKDWLERNSYPWIYLNQLPNEFYSDYLRRSSIRRPDFFVLVPKIAPIAIDVKERSFIFDLNFYLSERELAGLKAFDALSRVSTWVSFFSPGFYDTCFMLNILDAEGVATRRSVLPSGEMALHIPMTSMPRVDLSKKSHFSVFLDVRPNQESSEAPAELVF